MIGITVLDKPPAPHPTVATRARLPNLPHGASPSCVAQQWVLRLRLCKQDAQVHVAYDVRSKEDDAHLEARVPTPLHVIIARVMPTNHSLNNLRKRK